MCDSIEISVGEVEVMTDPVTFWIFTSEIKTSLMQNFGSKFPIFEEMLIKLEAEPDVDILRRIAANALSPELVNSANSAIVLLFKSIGQPPEIIKKFRQKFNRLIEGRLFIDIINDMALKSERDAEMLNSMPGINLAEECIFN
ncbi:GSCOCG00012672001-RA-CDS [Cotesia congregata]|nr:GSCOCG00012672001-RA-CDS [Cotesia congregata]